MHTFFLNLIMIMIMLLECLYFLNFFCICYISLLPVCHVSYIEFANSLFSCFFCSHFFWIISVQGDYSSDGKKCGEGYWWSAQPLQHLNASLVTSSSSSALHSWVSTNYFCVGHWCTDDWFICDIEICNLGNHFWAWLYLGVYLCWCLLSY